METIKGPAALKPCPYCDLWRRGTHRQGCPGEVISSLCTTLLALAHMARLIERSANLLPNQTGYVTPEAIYRPAEEALAKAEGNDASPGEATALIREWGTKCARLEEQKYVLRKALTTLVERVEEHIRWPASLGPWCDGRSDIDAGTGEPGPCGDAVALSEAKAALASVKGRPQKALP